MTQVMAGSLLPFIAPIDVLPNNELDTKNAATVSENVLSIECPFEADTIGTALHVMETERDALSNLSTIYRTNDVARRSLAEAVNTIAKLPGEGGRLIVTGIGKSGKIAEKCVATMNSLGIRSAFLHPVEALHGDLGMVGPVSLFAAVGPPCLTVHGRLMQYYSSHSPDEHQSFCP